MIKSNFTRSEFVVLSSDHSKSPALSPLLCIKYREEIVAGLVQVLEAQEAEEEALAETQRQHGSWLWFKSKTLEWNQERGYRWLDFKLISSSDSSSLEEDGASPAERSDEQRMLSPRLVLEGDPRYHYFSAVMKFIPGAAAGTTDAIWTATYVPVGDMGPPEHIKGIAILVFKALAGAVEANYTCSESATYAI
ncbi:unnamed protein product [Sphagnum tenellum]